MNDMASICKSSGVPLIIHTNPLDKTLNTLNLDIEQKDISKPSGIAITSVMAKSNSVSPNPCKSSSNIFIEY